MRLSPLALESTRSCCHGDCSKRANHSVVCHDGVLDNLGNYFMFLAFKKWGWSGGAKVLGKLPVPGRPTYLDFSSARAYCTCNRCGWGVFGHFFSQLSLLFSFSLPLGDDPI